MPTTSRGSTRVQDRLIRDRGAETWWTGLERPDDFLVAYFSAEFGLDESLPVYSGGLGILAGDHLKAASELGVPLVGVGLFYRRGYFRQRLDEHDRQVERYPRNYTSRLPLELVPMAPVVELADESGELVPVRLGVWRAQVGRVSLYLLDTKVGGNPDWARDVTDVAVRRRPREPDPAGARARGRRRARAPAARPRADRVPHERGALGVLPARAAARARRGRRPRDRRRARAPPRVDRLHDAHAGAGRQRAVRPRARAPATSATLVARCGLAGTSSPRSARSSPTTRASG